MRSSNSGILLATLVAITVVSSFAHTVHTVNTSEVSSIRSLRSDTAIVDNPRADSGERVGFAGVSFNMENLINKLFKNTSFAQKLAIKAWLKSNVHPAEVFKTLRLNVGAAKLDDNPELVQWFRYATAYRKVHGDQALPDMEIYFILLRQYEAKDVTSLIQSLKKTSGVNKLATSMENSLSGSWINENLGLRTDPANLFNTLRLKDAGTKLDEVPVFHQWLDYVDGYRRLSGTWFEDADMILLFRNTMPEENVVTLIHSLRQITSMKEHSNRMQRLLVLESKSNKRLLDVWVKAEESPETVYNILGLSTHIMNGYHDNVLVIQWLRYIKLLQVKTPNQAFSNAQTLSFLERERPFDSTWDFATLFQMLKKTPDVKTQVDDMQNVIFRSWVDRGIGPKFAAENLAIHYPVKSVLLSKGDPQHLTWKAFTLYFATHKGGKEMLKKVNEAFANGDPRGALAATVISV